MAREATRPPSGFAHEAGVLWLGAIVALAVLAMAIQSTLLALATVLGVIPQLVLVVAISLACLDGERVGAAIGFVAGLLVDLLLPGGSITGLTALIYTLLGYAVGSFRQFASSGSVWGPVATVAVSSAVAEAGYASMTVIFGGRFVGFESTAKIAGLVVLYNTLLTPLVFPLVARVRARLKPEKVFRW